MSKAVVLLRVSSEGQTKRAGAEEGYSIEVQREGCYDQAARLEADVVKEFIAPAQSASKGMYPALRDALAFIRERGDIDHLIVYRLDRFARDELTQFTALAELRSAGVKLVSATEQIDETPQGMLVMSLLGAVNAYRSRDDGKKISAGLRKKAELGGTPTRARLGYLNRKRWDGKNDIRYVELDPERAPQLQWGFQAYATGEWSVRALADELYERGLRTRSFKGHQSGKVSPAALHEVLRDPYYIGVVEFKGIRNENGTHPTLTTPEVFDQVQQVLTAHALGGNRQRKHEHYLKGTIYCGRCGGRLQFTQCRGNGGRYDYYVCSGRHEGKGCTLPYLAAAKVEREVTAYYQRQVRFDAERVAELSPKLIAYFHHLTGYQERLATRCRAKVGQITAKRRQLVSDHLSRPKAIPLDVLEAEQAELDAALSAARAELAKVEADIGNSKRGLLLAQEFLVDAPALYERADGPARRRFNQAFFSKLFVGPEGIKGAELTDTFAALLADDLAKRLEKLPARPSPHFRLGSSKKVLVELAGLEPATSWVRSRRSSN
jgi:site-specific DNA recombinase